MTLFGGVLQARNSIENPALPLTSTALLDFLGIEPTHAGVDINEVKVFGLPGVWRAAQVTCGVPASLPFRPYKQQGQERVPATSRTSQVLMDPHPDMTPMELWETVKLHRKFWGNAYIRKLKGSRPDNPAVGGPGIVSELWPIHPSRVKCGRETDSGFGRKVYSIDGGREEYVGDDVIMHIPGMGYDGICGVSPVRAMRQSFGLTKAAEEFGSRFFGSGALASGLLQTEQRLTEKQANALHRRWKAKRSGMGGAHDTIVLDRGAKFEKLTIPNDDAQFLETRMFQLGEICRAFGLPPFLMFLTEKSTSWGTGLEQQLLGWVTIDLRRDLTGFEQRVTKGLELQQVDEYTRFSLEGLLRGDSKARAEFYKAMWELGVFSTNEIRALEDRGPVEGGDVRYRPLNFGLLGEFDSPATSDISNPEEAPADA